MEGKQVEGVAFVTVDQMNQAFARLGSEIRQNYENQNKISQHNNGVVQGGFYRQDIWTETLKTSVQELGGLLLKIAAKLEVEHSVPTKADGTLDLEPYWNKACETINEQMNQAKAARHDGAVPAAEPIIKRADDEEPVEFGGDYEASEQRPESRQEAP